ncbi:MAG: helix-turn-helix transcriptional regulator [Nocardioidaceae bacterium]|nr:MAG: helix-turn-helix transcriptional regulator [Nocardioidaceae bacterium]
MGAAADTDVFHEEENASSVPPAEYCPVSIGAKLIGDRWTLLIIRELIGGALGFNEIHRGLPGLNRTMLAERLRYLERLGAVRRTTARPGMRSAYRLTPSGADLRDVIVAIGAWTVQWHFPEPAEVDTDVPSLLWRMYQGIRRDLLPNGRIVLEFRFPETDPSRGWIRIDPKGSRVCVGTPEGRADLIVEAAPRVLSEVWFGFRDFTDAVREGAIVVDGPASLTRELPGWFQKSAFADMVKAKRSG